jgi:beta-lactamase regulating signal transducer with metallopeptidase domain
MNAIGIALVWCIVQVTLVSLLVGGLYLAARWLCPAAAAPIVLTGLVTIVILTVLALSPWPRWTIVRLPPAPMAATVMEVSPDETFNEDEDDSAAAAPLQSIPDQDPPRQSPQPGPSRLLAQAIAEELVAAPSADSTHGWRWPALLAAILLTIMACGLGWFVLAMFAVRWRIKKSRLVEDRRLSELLDVLCAELGCLRPIEVRQDDDLVTAAMVGWRRPTLLLPRDWTTWTEAQRRAVLAHEIAHARGHDCLAAFCGQLAMMLHVYHPVLHWLANRLRMEQELAADATAASLSGGQRQYLVTIAELALRQQDRPLFWPARTFLPTRTTFLRRITMLRDNKLSCQRLSPHARLIAVGIVALGGILVAGLRGPEPVRAEDRNTAMAPAQAIKTFKTTDKLITKDGIRVEQDCWRIEARRRPTVRLFEVPMSGVDNCTLYYRAKMKSESLDGKAYLEMWCRVPSGGEYFSRGLMNTVSGTTDWASYETPFYLKAGQRPDLIKLNVIVAGTGTLWIKDVELVKGPLPDASAAADDASATVGDAAQLMEQGWKLWQEQRLQQAGEKFRQATKLAPKNANAWNGLGWACFNSGKLAEAQQAFERVVAISPDHPAGLNGLGQLNLLQRKYDQAEKYLLKASPNAPAAWWGLARLYLLQGKFDKAEKWAQKIIDSGEADDDVRQMLQAAKEKHLSESLRSTIEPPPAKPAPATAYYSSAISSTKSVGELAVVNGNMEKGDSAPLGWTKGAAVPGVTYVWDKTVGHGSQRSLCLNKTVARYFPIAQWSQSLPNPGTTSKLRVSAWVKAEKATKGIVDVQFLRPDDQAHSWSHQWVAYIGAKEPDAPPVSHDWTQYVGVVEIPSGTKTLGVGLQIYGPGKIWFDDVTAQFVPEATPTTDAVAVPASGPASAK